MDPGVQIKLTEPHFLELGEPNEASGCGPVPTMLHSEVTILGQKALSLREIAVVKSSAVQICTKMYISPIISEGYDLIQNFISLFQINSVLSL